MPTDPKSPIDPAPMTPEQVLAEVLRENERLRRQLADAQQERDQFKKYYLWELARNSPEITPEEIANAVPALPLLEQAIKQLEQP